jgi:hypothetical protein
MGKNGITSSNFYQNDKKQLTFCTINVIQAIGFFICFWGKNALHYETLKSLINILKNG